MPAADALAAKYRRALGAVGLILLSSMNADPTAMPTLTSGSGAPSAAEPNGSIYCRTNGTIYLRQSDAWSALTGASLTTIIGAAATKLTIASGSITVTQLVHTVETEGAGSTDDLTDIAGGSAEQLVLIRPFSGSHDVVVKHAIGSGKIACPGGRDLTLAETTDWALLAYNGTQWTVLASSQLSDVVSAILAENTDVAIPLDLMAGSAVAGTWNFSRTAAATYKLARTAAASVQTYYIKAAIRQRTASNKGFKVTGFRIQYKVSTADLNDFTVTGAFTTMPATGAAVAAPTNFGAVTYDADHDSAAERKAQGEHTMTGTFASPVYLNQAEVELLLACDGTASGVLEVFKVELLGSETLVDAA